MNRPNWKKRQRKEIDGTVISLRAEIYKAIRTFFETRDFLEIDAPLVTPFPTLDANIHSIQATVTDIPGKPTHLFLHTSPEHAMKKLLPSGIPRMYFLGKVFRDREFTNLHNPEFTMLEWYRTNASYVDIQTDAETLIHHVAQSVLGKDVIAYNDRPIDLRPPWDRQPLASVFLEKTGIRLGSVSTDDALRAEAERIDIQAAEDDNWETLFFRIFLERVEPGLGIPKPMFILDYPSRMGLMAKNKETDPEWVERAELYVGGVELATGYSELLDPDEQMRRFLNEQEIKKQTLGLDYPVDTELIHALEHDIPPSAGMSIGVDRLIMLFADKHNIQDVLLFPLHDNLR